MVNADLIRQRRGKSFECSFQTTQCFKIETLHLISLFLSITDCPLARTDKEVPSYEHDCAQGFSLLKGGIFATVCWGSGPGFL